jgi:hypothetical protein
LKTLYKLLLFFAIFQMMAITVGALNIFPPGSTLYSDIDYNELSSLNSPVDIIGYLFAPESGSNMEGFTIAALVGVMAIAGGLVAWFTGSFVPVIAAVIGFALVPMLVKSQSFFSKLFSMGNSQALIYLGLCLGVGFIIIAAITLIELPTHGDS